MAKHPDSWARAVERGSVAWGSDSVVTTAWAHWPTGLVNTPVMTLAGYARAKRVVDVFGALTIGVALLPLILAIALAMQFQDGPLLFRHRRIGRGGELFECLKFRTMALHAQPTLRRLLETDQEARAEWLRCQKLRDDPRVTRFGRFLRRTSLDELPQLWNVLRGEMSLVGPRPIVKEEMQRYGRYLPAYLSAKPGLTGLWQVSRRDGADYRHRVAMDVQYVRKWSLLLDLRILMRTPQVMIWGHGAY